MPQPCGHYGNHVTQAQTMTSFNLSHHISPYLAKKYLYIKLENKERQLCRPVNSATALGEWRLDI